MIVAEYICYRHLVFFHEICRKLSPATMKKTILLFVCSCFALMANSQSYTAPEKIIIARLTWLYKVKEFAATLSWPEFSGSKNDIALAYFTDTSSYISDPGIVLQQRVATKPFYRKGKHSILKTDKRIDDRPFHMETAMDMKDSSLLYFNYPVMMCSAYESTLAQMPDLGSLQEWAAMVIHEYFHGFQFRNPGLTAYGDSAVSLRGSQLQAFYNQYDWFKASIDQENKLLLHCLTLTDSRQIKTTLRTFCSLRESRTRRLEDSLSIHLALQEAFYEKLEGTAKYVELNLIAGFKKFPADRELQLLDTAYKTNAYQHFDLNAEQWRYTPGSISYFYATGYNLLRVLDHLNVSYKKGFFKNNELTPYSLLKTYLEQHP